MVDRVQAINVTQVRSFLGLADHYRYFVESFLNRENELGLSGLKSVSRVSKSLSGG